MIHFIIYLLLSGFGITFAILYTQYQIAIFVGVLLLLPIFSYVLSIIAGILVKVDIEAKEEQIHQEEEFKIRLHVKNRSIFPIMNGVLRISYGYEIGDKKKQKIKFRVIGRGETVQNISLNAAYCGNIRFVLYGLSIQDYFHVFSFRKRMNCSYGQVIYPMLQNITLDIQNNTSFYNDEYEEFYEDHPGNDPSEIYDIRDYREGDKLQRIHWKLSSKRDQYMVKEYSDPVVIDAVVICDNSSSYEGMELVKWWSSLLERTAQVSYSLLMNKVNHYVYWFDEEQVRGEKKEVRDEKDLHICINQLLQCKRNRNPQMYVNYLLHSEEVGNYSNIFYVGEVSREQLEENGVKLKVVE